MDIFKLVGSVFVDTDKANESLKKTDEKAGGVSEKFGKVVSAAGKMAVAIGTAAATAAVAIGKQALSAVTEFESSFAQVKTLLSDTTDVEAYQKKIIDLSNEMGIATDDLCSAVYSAISAGIDEADAVNFTAEALKLAEGGFTDAATAVDVMTTALNSYGLSAEDASQISDYLITTQNLGKTTVDELASSLGKVIPVASAYGVEMDNLSANMAILTKNGIATAEATTYTKAMLNELGDSGSTVSAVLQEQTGKSFAELTEEGSSLGDVMQILGDSVNGDSGAFNELWSSSEAGIGALSLLSAGSEEYNSVLQEMRDSAGATEEAYNTMHDTMSARMETLKTNVHNLFTELGTYLLPAAENVIDIIMNNMPIIQESVAGFGQILANAAEMVLPVLADLAQSLLPIIFDLMNQLLPVFSQIVETILPALTSLITMLLPPIIQIAESVMPLLFTILEAITPVLSMLIELLQPIIQLFVELVAPIVSVIAEALQPLIEIVSTLIQMALQPLIEIVKFLGSLFSDVLGDMFSNASAIIDNIIGVFKGISTFLKGIFSGDLKTAFKGIIEVVKNIFGGIVNIVKSPVNQVIGMVNKFVSGIITRINDVIGVLNGLKIDIPDWVPSFGGKTFGFNISEISNNREIPYLAQGGNITNPGKAVVGEAGAELIDLPEGARVTPLTRDQQDIFQSEEILAVLRAILEEVKGTYEVIYNAVTKVLNEMGIKFNERELARLVRKYAG